MGTLRAGLLDKALTFEVKDPSPEDQDSFGAPQENWVTDFEVRGAFEPLGSNEFHTAWKRNSETTARFRIRNYPGLVIDPAKHRITMILDAEASPVLTSTWDIYPPIPVDGKLHELYIEAREVVVT